MKRLAVSVLRSRHLLAVVALATAAVAGLSLGDSPATQAATKYTAFAGGGSGGIAVEAFLPKVIFVTEGDTVEWTNPYEEIHTVTFLGGEKLPDLIVPAGPPTPPGVAPPPGPPKLMFNPKVANPTTASSYDGTAYANSGIIGKGQTFTLSFPKRGTYDFLCVVHPGMEGSVNVLPAGSTVPTQAQRDVEAQTQLRAMLAAGERSAASVSGSSARNADGTTTYTVVNAPSAGQTDVMRFIPARLQVNVGDTVVWNNNTPVPHTVTFGGTPDLIVPEFGAGGPAAGPPSLVLNPVALFPSQAPRAYDGSGLRNSGFLGTGPEATAGTSFTLTFTKAGTYSYVCLLHADQGMAGVIQVGAGAPGGGITPPSTGDAGLRDSAAAPLAGWQFSLLGVALLLFTGAFVAVRSRRSA